MAGPCVDLDDSTTWNNNITDYGNRSYRILDNITLCTNTYRRNTSFEMFIFNGSFVLDCNGSRIINELGLGKAVLSIYNHSKVQNCIFQNFMTGANVVDIDKNDVPIVPWNWTKNFDSNTFSDSILDIAVDKEGYYVLVGHDTRAGGADNEWRVVKLDSNSNELWNWSWNPSAGADYALALAIDQDNDYYIGGYENSPGDDQWRIMKLDSDGNLLWNWSQNPSVGSDTVCQRCLKLDQEGNLVIAGNDDIPGEREWRVVKLTSAGDVLWNYTRNFSGSNDFVLSFAVDQDNNYVFGGDDRLPAAGDREWRIMKLDSDGNALWNWSKNFSNTADYPAGVAVDQDGNYFFVGRDNIPGHDQFRFVKFDKNGNELWNITYDPQGASPDAVFVDQNNNYFIPGASHAALWPNQESVVLAVQNNGSILWNYTQNPSGFMDNYLSVTVDLQGNILAGGFDMTAGMVNQWRFSKLVPPTRRMNGIIFENVTFLNTNKTGFVALHNASATLTNFTLGYNSTKGKISYSALSQVNASIHAEKDIILNSYFVSLNSSKVDASLFNVSANITLDSNWSNCYLDYFKSSGFPQNKSAVLGGNKITPDFISCSDGIVQFSTVNAFSGYAAAAGNQPPVVAIMQPADKFSTTNTNVFFKCNATDDQMLSNLTLFIWRNRALFFQSIKTVRGVYNESNWSISLPVGGFEFNCRAEDNGTLVDWNVNLSLNISSPRGYRGGGSSSRNAYSEQLAQVKEVIEEKVEVVERPEVVVEETKEEFTAPETETFVEAPSIAVVTSNKAAVSEETLSSKSLSIGLALSALFVFIAIALNIYVIFGKKKK